MLKSVCGGARWQGRGTPFLLCSVLIAAGVLASCGGSAQSANDGRSVLSIAVSPGTAEVPVGDSERFAATALYSEGKQDFSSTVVWSSSHPEIASVDRSGMAVAKSPGTTTITASSGSLAGSATLTVPDLTLVSIAITASKSLPAGGTQQLAATGNFVDGSTKDMTHSVVWSSNTASVAWVDDNGFLTATGAGSAMITATLGVIRGAETITVSQAQVSQASLVSLALSPPSATIAIGATQQFAVTGTFSDGTTQNLTSGVSWNVSPPGIATVNSSGLVTATAAGTAVINATSGSVSAASSIVVPSASLTSLAILPSNPSLMKGSTEALTVTGTYSDGSKHDVTSSVAWGVSPASIATISAGGNLTAVTPGTATVTASLGSVSATDAVIVTPPTLTSIAISPANLSLPKGEAQALTATGTYSDGSTQDLTKTVSWVASNSNVSVDSSGSVTAQSLGTSTVTATSGSVSGTENITVTVPVITSVAITPAKSSVTQGSTKQFQAQATYSDGSKKNVTQAVTWAVAQSDIAGITPTGLLTGLELGSTAVTATSGMVVGTATVTIKSAVLVSIAISPRNPSVVSGDMKQLTATGTYSDGSTQDLTSQVSWSSDRPYSALFILNGMLVGKQPGISTITATLDSIVGFSVATVSQPNLSSLAVSPQHDTLASGGSVQLTALATYTDLSTQDVTTQVNWSAAPAGIVTVSSTGYVTAQTFGTVTITGSSGQISASAVIIVSPSGITIKPANASILVGGAGQLRAIATFGDGSSADVTNSVDWTIADPTLVGLDGSGGIQGLSFGSTTVFATAGSTQGNATVNVEPAEIVNYFNAANTPGADGSLRITNDGMTGENICAMVYVFSPDQQMSECCGCKLTRNGLLNLSISNDLNANPLTGTKLTHGTVQIVPAQANSNQMCDPTSYIPSGTLSAWSTHLDPVGNGFAATGEQSIKAPLNMGNLPTLQANCEFINVQGSGQGTCTCGTGDN